MRKTRNKAIKFKGEELCKTDIDMKDIEGEVHLELGKVRVTKLGRGGGRKVELNM